ncbi:trihelix transcription factor GTL1 [Andrographis paniculata]|uniref:trihelix transcription factor GTL1 n=1 Tax=Andrographis paniculata TaxID=175694 RepID=UPI0021E82EA7|nr:trihelix transcription factor GTL1 [Andrographis paniculata]
MPFFKSNPHFITYTYIYKSIFTPFILIDSFIVGMEATNGIHGGMYNSSNAQPPPGLIGLEMSLHHNRPPPPQNPQSRYPYGGGGGGANSKTKTQPQALTLSDDDEPGGGGGFTAENSADDGAGARKNNNNASPWQRMKWTDNMVRLLIMVVFYIGDEVAVADPPAADKKKGGGAALQKKGKWKSVSRAMMERGFYVSPQQCEDKFNDLNKRYKRVNDILGKGTACRVVEDQSLLHAMDHLSPKLKEEVKKLLNSKHLFFREMCAYHNSCAHAAPPEAAAAPAPPAACLHSSETTKEDDDDNDNEEDSDENDDNEDEDDEEEVPRKRARKGTAAVERLRGEVAAVWEDGGRTAAEKMQWMRGKQMQVEEQRIGLQSRSMELEKQRLKWLRFSSKKEREMEKEKLGNERLKLENERMALMLRQKELDIVNVVDLHRHYHSSSSSRRAVDHHPSSITG